MKICGFNQIEKEATLILTTASMQSYVKLGRLMMTLKPLAQLKHQSQSESSPCFILILSRFAEVLGR
jgi:hypothetical protein